MATKEMSTLIFNDQEYEIVDDTARSSISTLSEAQSNLVTAVNELDSDVDALNSDKVSVNNGSLYYNIGTGTGDPQTNYPRVRLGRYGSSGAYGLGIEYQESASASAVYNGLFDVDGTRLWATKSEYDALNNGKVSKSGNDTMTGNLTIASGSPNLGIKNTDIDTTVETAMSDTEYATLGFYDKNGYYAGYVEAAQYSTDGHISVNLVARTRNPANTGNINHGLYLGIKKDGTKTVTLDQAAWRSALGLNTITYNSGWQTLTLNSAFQLYGSTPVQYRRIGNIVEIEGIIQPTAEITGGGSATIGVLPVGYRPSTTQFQVCQGSTKNSWLLEINSEGTVSFQRYGAGGSYVTAPTTAWLPFSAVFVTVNTLP